ncbi:MAG: hypothetical protein BIFFINMI_02923 [Phycisphaerae bacterium]|nr:hypothetical protein [Phycisphaerae bacterium]
MTQQSPDNTQTREETEVPSPPAAEADDRLVPVSESIRYRRRAQSAERRAAELDEQLAAERQARQSAESDLLALQRRTALVDRLAGRNVADIEAALLLAEARLVPGVAPEAAELDAVIEQLLAEKPYLLAGTALPAAPDRPGAPTMTTPTRTRRGPGEKPGAEQLREAARAAAGGRPEDVNRYLAIRRRFR